MRIVTTLSIFWVIACFLGAQNEAEKDQWLALFEDNYEDCRQDFRQEAQTLQAKFNKVDVGSIHVPSEVDDDLTVDYCYIPAQQSANKLLIVSSGIHGIEGFVGNAVMNLIIDEYLDDSFLQKTGVLLIHGMNPFGFKYSRRVTENNVDLNRNSTTDRELYKTINTGYTSVYDLLNPGDPCNSRSLYNRFFVISAVKEILKAGMSALRQAVLQGQYEYPEGLYFGGKQPEPQIIEVGMLIQKVAAKYEVLMNIDLHTGYGERGKMHFFPNPIEDSLLKATTEAVFEGYEIDWGDSDDFYTITGDFSGYITKLNPGKTHIPMTFEYGTLDSQKTMGSIKSIHNMILENQGSHHGFKKDKDQRRVLKRFTEMYYPSDPAWRIQIMQQTKEALSIALANFASRDIE